MSIKSMMLAGIVLATLCDGGAALAQAVSAGPAAVTDATAPGDEIIVTGSRIRRDPLNQDSPVVVLDAASIQQTGLSAIADILQRLRVRAAG